VKWEDEDHQPAQRRCGEHSRPRPGGTPNGLRERQIEIALADYFEAVARAERVRAEARRKADAVLEAGEQAAGEPETAARDAVRRLRELACSVGEVAALCGISTAGVRELLAVAGTSGAAAAGSADPLPGPADRPGVSGHAG